MKKLIQINSVCNGSTGKIMGDIQREALHNGYETISIYGRRKGYQDIKCIKVGGPLSFFNHILLTTILDMHGLGSYFKTKKIVKILRKENPDIIHLHNIHGYYLNYPLLFKFLKEEFKGKVFWTLHDCWPFTGHCPYFSMINCNKWKHICNHCPQKRNYPISWFRDRSSKNYTMKKKWFTGLKNLTIITPSQWLENLVKESFLKDYKIVTINNGIDLDIFHHVEDNSIKIKYGIPLDKKILLGVANIWEERKGLKDFIELSKKVSKDYQIVLVGVTKKQMKKLPPNIMGIKRTENQLDLVKLYSSAEFFINPTYEDNYPTVNLEALACNTKVITYDTGGSKEQINDSCGVIIKKGTLEQNIDSIINAINKEYSRPFKVSVNLDKKNMTKEIAKLYE